MKASAAFTLFWQLWLTLSVGSFLVVELWALCTNWHNTLSAFVWRFEKFQDGQPVHSWTAAHFLFIAVLLLLDVWLVGHFGWGLWR